MLALEKFHMSYGTRPVLADVSLHVRPGELLGFVGANGAGKTTSMRILLGIARPGRGRATLDDVPVDATTRTRMGYMPEERGLFPSMRVQQQLEFFAELRGLNRRSARRAAAHWIERLGLTGRHHTRLEELSLGNQQRVQLAAAVLHAPEALVLDEPFSGLDPVAVDLMAQVLREEAARGVPVLFSSHQLELVERVCDRVAILHAGRIVATGTVDELTRSQEPRYLVRSTTAPALWTAELPHHVRASAAFTDDGDVTLRLESEESLRQVIRAIDHHGVLTSLQRVGGSLADAYRAVLAASDLSFPPHEKTA